MTKFNKFKKMCELIIELAELATIEGVDGAEAMSIRNHMEALCPEEYEKVKDTLFPQAYYPYAYSPNPNSYRPYFNGHDLFENSNNWNSPWTPDSPVPVRPVTANTNLNQMINGIQDETATITDATKFVNAIKQFLPKGHLNKQFSVMGEIINAIRDKEFERAVQLVKDNWIEGEDEELPPKNDGMYVPNIFPNESLNTIFGGNTSSEEEPVEDDITD
jgi:hypothetical protein